jgi:hypothetical protein
MKELLLATIASLLLGAPAAMADGFNLAWGRCRAPMNTFLSSTNDFTPQAPCDDPAFIFVPRHIVCSFKNSTPMLQWQGVTIRVDMLAPGALTDWWQVGPGGCRDGALSAPATALGASNCTNPYTLVPTDPAGESELSSISVNAAFGHLRYEATHVRNSLPVDLPVPSSTGGYLADNLVLTADLNDQCLGCDQPVSMALNFVRYFGPNESREIQEWDLNACITYTGGSFLGCYEGHPVPTRSVTWGHMKQLYR